jgi:hypothetical protein
MMSKLEKIKLRINLFFVFLQWCCLYPNEIKENWDDMNRRYFNETDPEMLKIFKELEDESNIPR